MSGVAPSAPAAAPPERSTPSRRRGRATARRVVAGLALLALAVVSVWLLARPARSDEPLDPTSAGPSGTKALAEVLRDEAVDVEVVGTIRALRTAERGPGTTVVLSVEPQLTPERTREVAELTRDADRFVVLAPDALTLQELDLPVTLGDGVDGGRYEAGCRGGLLTGSGVVRDGDEIEGPARLVVPGAGVAADRCFASDLGDRPGGALVALPAGDGRPETVLLGAAEALTNRQITEAAHAGIGVRLLGASDRLVWYSPTPADLADGGDGVMPAPPWVGPAIGLLGVAAVVLALQRGRRLGRLVPERLPVVVRAAETTRSRAALYRRAGDRPRAAAILRTATARRVRRRLAVGEHEPPHRLVEQAAGAADLPAEQVHHLLMGPPPTTDAALVDLAAALTDLERRIRRT